MKIAVVGVGGVGGYFGGRLARAGFDVTFIARGATLEALRTRGLRVDSVAGDFTIDDVQATDDPRSAGPVDVILMAVKAWQLEEAARNLGPMIGGDTVVVPLENGIDAADVLAPIVGDAHIAGGLCAIVSYIVAPGHIRHPAYDPTVMFGELDRRRSPRLERLRDAFVRAGVNATIPADIHHSIWTKFLFISVFSGIGAITRVPVDVWRADPDVRKIAEAALREVVDVARARGVELEPDAVARTLERYDAMATGSTASMQRDVMDGKPSELDAQLGATVRLGAASGVPTPVNAMLYHLLLPQERAARGVVPSARP